MHSSRGVFPGQGLNEEPESSDINHSPMQWTHLALKEFIDLISNRKDVSSTKAFVKALNDITDGNKREVFVEKALKAYVIEFAKQPLVWDSNKLKEFTSLSELEVTSEKVKLAMRTWFAELLKTVEDINQNEFVIEALNSALLSLDPDIFEGDPKLLIDLAYVLIERLNPPRMIVNDATASRQCHILCALNRTFQLVALLDGIEWDMSKESGLFWDLKNRIDKVISEAVNCFPVLHHAKLVQQSIIHLGSKDVMKRLRLVFKETWKILKGLAIVWNSARSCVLLTFDLESWEKAWNSLTQDASESCALKWFSWLQCLSAMALYAMEDQTKLSCYLSGLDYVTAPERILPNEDDNHLKYGIIEQLTMLALSGCCPEMRDNLTHRMKDLKCSTGSREISENEDILKFRDECLERIKRETESDVVNRQFNGQPQTSSLLPSDSLFIQVRDCLVKEYQESIPKEASGLNAELLKLLKKGYLDNLSQTESPVTDQIIDVGTLKFNLMRIQNTDELLKPSDCVQLDSPSGRELVRSEFKTGIKLQELLPEDEAASRVVIMGMPGSGRSTLARRLAVDWAKGTWGSHFQAVFSLSLSARHKEENIVDSARPSLSGVIVSSCFRHVDLGTRFEELRRYVEDELTKPTTLLILDGVEEAKRDCDGPIDALIKQAEAGNHKLLMMSLPETVHDKQSKVVELSCLTDSDIGTYLSVEDIVSQSHIQDFPHLWELARHPTRLLILQSSMCPTGRSVTHPRPRICRKSRACHYHCLTKLIWQCCGDGKKNEIEPCKRDDAFDELGEIALTGLVQGRCCVEHCDLEGRLPSPRRRWALVNRGLLMCNCQGDFEFTHSILMKYFVGRLHARRMFLGGQKQTETEEYVQKNKYVSKHADSMSIMAGEIGRDKGGEGIRKFCNVIDSGSMESFGIHQLGLKMNAFQEWLLEGNTISKYNEVTKEFKVCDNILSWLKIGMKRVRKTNKPPDDVILKIVIQLLKDSPKVVAREKETLLLAVLEELKKRQWDVDDLIVEVLALIVNVNEQYKKECMDALVDGLNDASKLKQVLLVMRLLGRLSVKCCRRMLQILIEDTATEQDNLYWDAIIDLLQYVHDFSRSDINRLADICKNRHPTHSLIANAVPKILTDRSQDQIAHFLYQVTEGDAESLLIMSPSVIEVLGFCMKTSGQYEEDVVQKLLHVWPRMKEEQRKAASQALLDAIRVTPAKTIEIVGRLLDKAEETSDPQISIVLKKALSNEDWIVRSLAFRTIGIITHHHNEQLTGELINWFVEGCRREVMSNVKCAALDAATQIVTSVATHAKLLPMCYEALGDADEEIRKLSGTLLNMAVSCGAIIDQTLTKLLDTYSAATVEERHGVVHCLNLLVQDFPETAPRMKSVFMEAANSHHPTLCSAGLLALSTMVEQTENDSSEIMKILVKACKENIADVKFSALEAIGKCVFHDSSHLKSLIEVLEPPPNPKNDNEWMIYLSLLQQAVMNPREETKPFLEVLLSESPEESSAVRNKRREIIDHLPLDSLLTTMHNLSMVSRNWFPIKSLSSPTPDVLDHIFRRFCQKPTLFDESSKRIRDLTDDQSLFFPIKKSIAKKLRSHIRVFTTLRPSHKKRVTFFGKLLK